MMREDLLQKVSTREALAILTDDSGNIVWETDKSPVAGMYHAYYEGGLSGTGTSMQTRPALPWESWQERFPSGNAMQSGYPKAV